MKEREIILPPLEIWQQEVFNVVKDAENSGKRFIIKAKRQVGKSILCIVLLIYYSLNKKGISLLIEPTQAQCRRVFKQIVDCLEGSGIITQANATLLKNDSLDDFNHEIVVAVNTPYGVVIISPCSHNGVLNTLDACSHLGNIYNYIGGTHLIDNFENEEELNSLASTLKIQHSNLALISGHCTGISAKNAFKNALNNKFIEFYTGFILETE